MDSKSKIGSADLVHILAKTREAAVHGPGPLSLGEALIAALVLNRPDWLIERNFTIAQALDRVGPQWARLIPAAANQFKQELEAAEYEAAMKKHRAQLAEFAARSKAEDDTLEFAATFVTAGNAPGYRDVSLTFDLESIGEPRQTIRTRITVRPQDGEAVVREILDVHRFAWRNEGPIDAAPGEQRPRWLDKV